MPNPAQTASYRPGSAAAVWEDFYRRDEAAREQAEAGRVQSLARQAAQDTAGRAFASRMQSEAAGRVGASRTMEAAQSGFAREQAAGRNAADAMADDAQEEQDNLAASSRAGQAGNLAASRQAGQSQWDRYLAGRSQMQAQAARPRTVDAVPSTMTAMPRESATTIEQRQNTLNYQRNLRAQQASQRAAQDERGVREGLTSTPIGGTVVVGGRLYIRSPQGLRPYDGAMEGDVEFATAAPATSVATAAVPATPTAPRRTWEQRREAVTRIRPWTNDSELMANMLLPSEADFDRFLASEEEKYAGVVPEGQRLAADMGRRTALQRQQDAQRQGQWGRAPIGANDQRVNAEIAAQAAALARSPWRVSNI